MSLIRSFLDETLLEAEFQVGIGLVPWGDPTVSDEETSQLPLLRQTFVDVSIEDGLGNVGDVLTCI